MAEQEESKKVKSFGKRKFLFRLLVLLILLPIAVFLLINIPAVQKFFISKYTNALSEKIGADITIDKVRIDVFNGLEANDIVVIDRTSKDTVLLAKQFSTGLKENLLLLLRNRLSLSELNLSGLRLNIVTILGDNKSNLDKFIEQGFGGPDDGKESKPFYFDLKELNLRDFKIIVEDRNKGVKNHYKLEQAQIEIDTFDLMERNIRISRFHLTEPDILLFKENLDKKVNNDAIEIEKLEGVQKASKLFSKESIPFHLIVQDFNIVNGHFTNLNALYEPIADSERFDPDNFSFTDIELSIKNLNISPDGIKTNIENLSADNKKGYDVKQMKGDLLFDNRNISLQNFLLKTDNSAIGDKLAFKYRSVSDFSRFADKVIIDSYFNDATISFKELTYYIPTLKNETFFRQNNNRQLNLGGKVKGKLNNLSGRDVVISLDDKIRFKGKFDTRDITTPEYLLINLQCDELISDVGSLKQILPAFNPPENYFKLGNIKFSGRFDGFYYDFVAYGDLGTSLGSADLDMRLDVKDGRDKANYSGVLNLIEFDLASWLDNDDLGKVSLQSTVKDGNGLTLSNAFADLSAEVKQFSFKEYNYENIILTGALDKNRFNGDFKIKNEDVDFKFNGNFQFEDENYITDFVAKINKIDLQALNLVEDPFVLKGDITSSIEGTGLKDFIGEAEFGGLELTYKDSLYIFDTLYINSAPNGLKNRNANIISEAFSLSLDGDFNLEKIPEVIKWQITKSYPYYASKLKIPKNSPLTQDQDLNFKITIDDSKNYFDLFGLHQFNLQDFNIKGAIDTKQEFLNVELSMDHFSRGDVYGYNLNFGMLNKGDNNKIKASIDSLWVVNRKFDEIYLNVDMNGNAADFRIDTRNVVDSLQTLNLKGKIVPEGEGIKIHFDNERWEMFSSEWKFSKDNHIILKDKYIEIKNFSMTDGYRIIVVDDIQGHKGVDLSLRNFDFKLVDGIIDYDKISFTGEGDVDVSVFNLFEKSELEAKLFIPDLMLNDINYGEATLDVYTDRENVIGSMSVINNIHNIKAFGTYNQKEKYLTSSVKALGFQMKFFEDFILTEGISKTKGLANIYVDVDGPLEDIKFNGEAILNNGGVEIDYLGNYIEYDRQRVVISETFLDMTGIEIVDIEGNVGVFTGGLRHNVLRDFVVDVDANADRFVGLNTTKADNPLYYGYGVGTMDIQFRGPFSSTDIKINATTAKGTKIHIPVNDYKEGYEHSFFTFVDSSTHRLTPDGFEAFAPEEFKIEGVDVEMNLGVTQDADMSIIFNEEVNDIIRGSGEGNLRVLLKRSGDFDIFGDYEVYDGEYLFTSWGLVAKPFKVKRGGRITWTGDPINANLDIDASYDNLRAPLDVFLSEYLVSAPEVVKDAAKQNTDVDLNLNLSGPLYEPIVSFDLTFPNLSGELRSYALSKSNTLRQNESEMNNQVVGLLVFNTFLPTSNNINSDIYTSDNILSTGYNTLSEFFSNQISHILSGFLEQALEENGFISGVDFDIGFSKNSSFTGVNTGDGTLTPDEIEVNFKNRFLNDRWELDLGGNFVRPDITNSINNNYIIGDFVIAYYLTEDKRLKLRGYGKYDIDEVQGQREQKYGFGLSYRKEFGTLFQAKEALKNDTNSFFESGDK